MMSEQGLGCLIPIIFIGVQMKIKKNEIKRIGWGMALWLLGCSFSALAAEPSVPTKNYEQARWNPLHFKPAIDTAKDEQCLECHKEILENSVKAESPAGVSADESLAWYQTLEVYSGSQETFHRRHLATPLAKELMNLKCNTCHQGNDPREESDVPAAKDGGKPDFTLRKMVNPETTCLKCHGQFNYTVMGLQGPWHEIGESMGNNCLTCHAAFRTNRHQVNYLNAANIEKAGQANADNCYGCHGGRSWYRISYPYPRHAWEGMAKEIPDWAKDRPTESEARFRLDAKK